RPVRGQLLAGLATRGGEVAEHRVDTPSGGNVAAVEALPHVGLTDESTVDADVAACALGNRALDPELVALVPRHVQHDAGHRRPAVSVGRRLTEHAAVAGAGGV